MGSNEFISPSPFQPDDDFSEEEANEDIDSVEERGWMNFEKYLKSDSSLLRDIIVVASTMSIPNTSTYFLAIDFQQKHIMYWYRLCIFKISRKMSSITSINI